MRSGNYNGQIRRSERGSAMPEFALLLTLLAVVVIAGINHLGNNARDTFVLVGNSIHTGGETVTTILPETYIDPARRP